MKKRGFQPTSRTYATIFSGCNQLSDSELTDKQWERVEGLWEQYQSYLESVRSQEDQDVVLQHSSRHDNILSPYVPFLELLGRRGLHDRIMPLFEELAESHLAQDKYVCTTFLLQIAQRTTLGGGEADIGDVYVQNAEDTQAIASKMQAAGVVDSFALTAILRGLVKGTEQHHQFGYDLVIATVGDISKPEEMINAKGPASVKLEHRLLDLVLELCCVMRKYEVALNLFDGLKQSPAKRILTRSHVDYALDALAYQTAEVEQVPSLATQKSQANGEPATESNSSTDLKTFSQRALKILEYAVLRGYGGHPMDILPNRATYNRVLVTAWRCGDWESAARAVELMTGLDLSQFRQSRSPSWFRRNITPQKSKDKVISLDAQSMGYLVRTANRLRDNSAIRVAVRLFDYCGFGAFFPLPRKAARRLGTSVRTMDGFYQFKLAAAIQESVIILMDTQLTPEQRADYKGLLEEVKEVKEMLKVHE